MSKKYMIRWMNSGDGWVTSGFQVREEERCTGVFCCAFFSVAVCVLHKKELIVLCKLDSTMGPVQAKCLDLSLQGF